MSASVLIKVSLLVSHCSSDTEFGDESGNDAVEEVYSVSKKMDSKEEELGRTEEEEEVVRGAEEEEEEEGGADHGGDDKEASDSDNDDLTRLVETLQSVVDSGSEQEALSHHMPLNSVSVLLGSIRSMQVPSVNSVFLVCSPFMCLSLSALCIFRRT